MKINRIGIAALVAIATSSSFADTPTFSNGVARIIHDKCTVCHRPDSSGPFALLTHSDVKRRASTIEAVLLDGFMPPWKPVDHGLAFANARSLSSQEKQAILSWISSGCPEGDVTKTPTPPTFKDGWSLGQPDMVVRMNGKFEVPADGPDIYRSFVFPLDLPEDKWVKAIELKPQAKSAVHHAIFFLDTNGNARKLDGADGKAGIEGMGFLANFGNDAGANQTRRARLGGALANRLRGIRNQGIRNQGSEEEQAFRTNQALNRSLGGYVPGSTPNLLPGDLSMALPKGSNIVMQTHFHPSGKRETEQAELALYFAERPPSRQIVPIMVPPMFGFGSKIKVPAGENNYRVSDSFKLPIDTQAIGVSGHAHYICREMKMTAKLPDGQTIVLLHIDDWDLDWQDQYLFEQPMDLPANTVLYAELVYDNSDGNPENPFHPPQEIRWGRGSNDEMGGMTLMTIPKKAGRSRELHREYQQYFLAKLVNQDGVDLVAMLMQLDNDHDGKLQRSEAPPRFNTRIFRFLDANNDDALEAEELGRMMKLRYSLPRFPN